MTSLARLFRPPPSTAAADRESHFISLIHSAHSICHLKPIHARLFRHGLSHSSRVITQLISAYAAAVPSSIPYALSVFHHFPFPNPFLFNALIRSLSTASLHSSSLSHFTLMLRLGLRPDRLTLPFALKSAASLPSPTFASALHANLAKLGVELDSFVRTSLADMYVKLGSTELALRLFEETPEWHRKLNPLLWNVMINGCCRSGDMKLAGEMFEAMPERSLASWNSLFCGFMRNGDPESAAMVFERMTDRNVVSWTTMVSGYLQNGDNEKALAMFDRMLDAGVRPNDFTLVSVLIACARMGALKAGVRIHEYITRKGFHLNKMIGAALVDMYSKCGKIEMASQVFDRIEDRDLLTWSAMISGWAVHGRGEKAHRCFEDMISAGIKPDDVVFLSVFMACSHSGMVEQGLALFNCMRSDYQIEPDVKHYTCMVDLFGRAGRLQEALHFIETMPVEADFVTWGALFCACRAHKNVEMGKFVSGRLQELKPKHHGSYIFLSNVFAGAGKWEDSEKVRNKMKDRHVDKLPGWSSIEIDGHMHNFVAGDQSHPCSQEIYGKLEELVTSAREKGYKPDTGWVLHNIEEEEKEGALGSHSEKLALAFGLLKTPNGTDVRIVKNLRVCGDCHSMMKFASRICRRHIVLRDLKRFHHFKDGVCSCGDYW